MSFSLSLRLFSILFLAVLSSCQSTRFPAWFPRSSSYSAARPALVHPTDSSAQTVMPVPEALDQPILKVALPTEKALSSIAIVRPRSLPLVKPFSKAFYQQVVSQQTPPDTVSAQRGTRPTPEQMRDADKANAFFHSIGVVLVVIGAVLIIAALAGEELAALAYGAIALTIGIPLLLFESTKSTSYMLKQEARAARKASKGR